ncbi:MAG: folylpolyglutamate synthase/dihydrofolate synthase family protein [Phycisphaerales bacterium]|jgi:dihydrofolate synthase/folylpolyglutamate synthase|nr:folylpolyglutamate synthase/dihydrofolate synthase family protein [Phycisphaerales bacterium]
MAKEKTISKKRTTKKKPKSKAKPIKTFSSAIAYLLEQTDYERMRVVQYDESTFKLDRMRTILAELGNPQDQVPMVHVAGTVGKGSTVTMLSSMLRGSGYAVGQYTSPHLIDMRERIVVNDKMIEEEEFTKAIDDVVAAAKKRKVDPTFFELITAAAFKHFSDNAVDIAVIETGLGGRLDSTNVIHPILTLITQIDLDHTHILGYTIEEIAKEKAGIFKKSIPAISCQQNNGVGDILRKCAEESECELEIVGDDIEFSSRFVTSNAGLPQNRICIITEETQFMHTPVPLPGAHQTRNCGLALAAICKLKTLGFKFEDSDLHESLSKSKTEGRMELAWNKPKILIDGAHNPTSLQSLIRCIGAHIPYDSMVCVFGCCVDKDVTGMLRELSLGADKIIFTKSHGNPRAAEPQVLQQQFAEISGKMTQVANTLGEAIEIAARATSRDDLICVTGSFYLVGDAKKHLAELAASQ